MSHWVKQEYKAIWNLPSNEKVKFYQAQYRKRQTEPIKKKAIRLKMSFVTLKVSGAPSREEIEQKICRPIRCTYCEKVMILDDISIDHTIPKSRGGLNHISNIQYICLRCCGALGIGSQLTK